MSVESKTGASPRGDGEPIPFGRKYTESEKFSVVFREGMALVEATAAYLDGDGRKDARELNSTTSLAYATVSMRLTTRLMQLASWLLIRRAVNDGEMTPSEAFEEQNKVKFQPTANQTKDDAYEELPERLRELNETSMNLYRRVLAIDRLLRAELEGTPPEGPANRAIGDQMSRLTDAFGPVSGETGIKEVPSGDSE